MDPPLTMYVPTMITSHHHQVDTNCIKLLSKSNHHTGAPNHMYRSQALQRPQQRYKDASTMVEAGYLSQKYMAPHLLKSTCLFFDLFLCQHLRPFETIRMSEVTIPSSKLIIGFQTIHRRIRHISKGLQFRRLGKNIFLAHVDDHSKCTCAGSMAMICLRADEPRENVLSIA